MKNRTLRSAGFFLSGLYPMPTGPNLTAGYNESLINPPFNISNTTSIGNMALPNNY